MMEEVKELLQKTLEEKLEEYFKDQALKWQPIETAPTGSDLLLLYGPSEYITPHIITAIWINKKDGGYWQGAFTGHNLSSYVFTHWQYAPEPPENKK